MREWIVDKKEAGGRLDKYLKARLKEAPDSFFYKMARKKNLTLNGRKCKGNELLKEGDAIKLFVSDATIALFEGGSVKTDSESYLSAHSNLKGIEVLKETEDLVFLYKPAGILSQKAKDDDESLNEWLIGYLLQNGSLTEEDLKTFVPSVLNRLDRNTSGIVLGGKTLRGSRFGSQLLKDGVIRKFYFCIVDKDSVHPAGSDYITLAGFLYKNEATNKVTIYRKEEAIPTAEKKDAKAVSISVKELSHKQDKSLLEVELHSGKSHQIRALLAEYGSPILGDTKYGNEPTNNNGRSSLSTSTEVTRTRGQLLCAARVEIPADTDFKEDWMNEYKGLTVKYMPDFAKDFIS